MRIDLRKIENLIREVAAEEVMPHWRNLKTGEIREKTGPLDVVTVADAACENVLSRRLMDLFPGSVVVGEEACEAEPQRMQMFGGDAPVWVIDPIDGTMAFAEGRTDFDVMLALVWRKQLLAGWIYAPAEDAFIMGQHGEGALRLHNGTVTALAPVSKGMSVHQMTGILGKKFFTPERRAALKGKAGEFSGLLETVNAGHDYARLASGEAQFAIYGKTMPWDHMPGLAILSALGFTYAKHDGRDYMCDFLWQGGLLIAPDDASMTALREILVEKVA